MHFFSLADRIPLGLCIFLHMQSSLGAIIKTPHTARARASVNCRSVSNNITTLKESYDYIIVGGGTAGLVVAARLSEDGKKQVLVIEAGGDQSQDPYVQTPGLVSALYGKEQYDWNFTTPPQPSLNDRVINQPRGRMLGGSSSMNLFMMVYPTQSLLDSWETLGNPGWNFGNLRQYFRKFAKTTDPSKEAVETSRMEGQYDPLVSLEEYGPTTLGFSDKYNITNSDWMDTFAKFDLKQLVDPRNGLSHGAIQQSNSIDPTTHTRTSSASAYLSADIRARPNLDVLINTVVKRVVFEKGTDLVATGVIVKADGTNDTETTIKANKEVILAAGSLQSPQLLELSGIGGKDLLEKYNIPVLVDNPNVGEHMQDHPIVCQNHEVVEGVATTDVLRDTAVLNAALAEYADGGKGPMGQTLISIAQVPMADTNGTLPVAQRKALLDQYLGNVTTADSTPALEKKAISLVRDMILEEREPALQYLVFPGQTNIQKDGPTADIITPSRPENAITIMTMLHHPFSRGHVHIVSSDVDVKPVWNPLYNDREVDLELLAHGVRFAETLVSTEPLKSVFRVGGKRVPSIVGDTLDNAREIVRQAQISVFHPSGSCIMAPEDLGGVVDNHLRVYGVKGLRVVDASILPIEPTGNIQSTVYAVAEKAADLIKADNA